VGEAVAIPVCRGRESTGCCALLAFTIKNESAAVMPISSPSRFRRAANRLKVRSLITTKPSLSKSPLSNDFRYPGEYVRAKSIAETDFTAS
jgi:hypothetical protein